MAITKIHPIKSTINLAIRYITQGDKTDEKILISTNNCEPFTAHIRFNKTRDYYQTKGTVLARHLIQSFYPGEVTQEKAHEIGQALCDKILNFDYEYLLATHIDKGHIHNHIIFNNVSYKNGKCYQSNKRTYHKIRDVSDELCKENRLIVIDEFYESYKKRFKTKGKSWYEYNQHKQGKSWKSKLAFDIDNAIIKAKDFEDFKSIMISKGYEIKEGKHIAFKHKDKERFTRCKTIGEDYVEDRIKERIKNEKHQSIKTSERKLNTVIDAENIKAKNSKGYEIWAKKHNLKTMASSISRLRKLGINTKEQLENYIKKQMEHRQNLLDKIKIHDKEIDKLSHNMEDINTVNKYRKLYLSYKNDPKNKDFKDYQPQLTAYKKALENLKKEYETFPSSKDILERLEQIEEKKENIYKEYSAINTQNSELNLIKNNYEKYINKNKDLDL